MIYENNFKKNEIYKLKCLRKSHDEFSELFYQRNFGFYIPFGVAITHIASLSQENRELLSSSTFNNACLSITEFIIGLIFDDHLTLVKFNGNPIHYHVAQEMIRGAQLCIDGPVEEDGTFYDFTFENLFGGCILISELISFIQNKGGIHEHDSRLIAIEYIHEVIKNTKDYPHSNNVKHMLNCKADDLLYYPVKKMKEVIIKQNANDNSEDNALTKKQEHNQKVANIKNNAEYNDDIKRVLIAEQHILYLGLDIGCNLSDHGFMTYDKWYAELKDKYGNLFDVGIHNYKKYVGLTRTSPHIKREVKLHKFNKGTPKRASNKG